MWVCHHSCARWWSVEVVFMRLHLPIVIAKWKIFSHFLLSAALLIVLLICWLGFVLRDMEKANILDNLFVCLSYIRIYFLIWSQFLTLFYPHMKNSAWCLRFLVCAELHPLLDDVRWGSQSWAMLCEERYRTFSDSFVVCCSFCAWWVPWRSVQFPELWQVCKFRTQHWAHTFWEASLGLCLLEWNSVCHSWHMNVIWWNLGITQRFL